MTTDSEIKNIKNHADLIAACANKYLVINSSGKPGRDYNGRRQNKGGLGQVWIFSNLGHGLVTRMANLFNGYGEFRRLSTDLSPAEHLSSNEVFEFFAINKRQRNRIYIIDSLDLITSMQAYKKRLDENLRLEQALLKNDVTHLVEKKLVMRSCYAVVRKIDFLTRCIEFDYDGKGYRFFCSGVTALDDSKFSEGRTTALAGYSREEKIYRVDKKICKELFRLYTERTEIATQARNEIVSFVLSEHAAQMAKQAA